MADPSPASFPASRRLLDASAFQAVFRDGRRSPGAFLRLHFLAIGAPAPARLGLAVPKKAVPLSVERNRIKRQCRECFRQRRDLPPGDYVLVAQAGIAGLDNAALRHEIDRLFSTLTASGPAQTRADA